MLPTKSIEKIADPNNAKDIVILIWREKIRNWWDTQQLKAIENTTFADIKSVIMEHPKTSHKLSQNVRKDERLPK